ncbi:MAG: hypothetical protein ABL876_15285, partial [Chitinophagaceae bacterium]
MNKIALKNKFLLWVIFCLPLSPAFAQTDIDGVMMEKNAFCLGPMYGYSSWKNYWEGTLKRDNANMGKVSTTMSSIMGNYGITNKLNVLFGVPYVKTKASAGQLKGLKGIQDLSLWVKWKAYSKKIGQGRLSLFAIGGYSLPASNYTADFLPMSIGLESKNLSLRAMADYQRGAWFATLSGTYIRRSNIELDRTAYYTTEMHYSNEVKMPDALSFNFRAGYRDKGAYVELVADNWTTLKGFDIPRNSMPFPSNKMNATRIGLDLKYPMRFHPALAVVGNAFTT